MKSVVSGGDAGDADPATDAAPVDVDDVDSSFRWRLRLAECRSRLRLDGKAAVQPSTVHWCINFRCT